MPPLPKLLVLFALNQLCTASLLTNVLNGTLNIAKAAWEQYNGEPDDTLLVHESYDFIVIGAGSAGCIVAARLAEDGDNQVLLIEAGGRENFYMDIPALAAYMRFTSNDWGYNTVNGKGQYCAASEGGRCFYGRGKAVGGSSAVNYEFYTRGHKANFDTWSTLGNDGWSYEEILPYFKKIENFDIGEQVDMKYHGTDGPIHVGYSSDLSPIGQLSIEASKQYGFKQVDYNGEQQIGVSRVQSNIKNGIRVSASRAYLHPLKNKKNFHLKKLSTVSKILIDSETKEAYGVEFVNSGFTYQVKARKEVILSAGAVNSPQILMLSGVGPKNHLQEKDIEVIQDLPVGQSSIDHILAMPLVYLTEDGQGLNATVGELLHYMNNFTGPFATTVLFETLLFANTTDVKNTVDPPTVEIVFSGSSVSKAFNLIHSLGMSRKTWDQMYDGITDKNAFGVFCFILQPESRGTITLKDNKYTSAPIIDPNYFDKEADLMAVVKGLGIAQEIVKQDAFKSIKPKLWDRKLTECEQYDFNTDDYWKCAIRQVSSALLHMVGTCRMGPDSDPLAVVDSTLKVKGLKNLRVVDASIMPHIPAAHTNAATLMVGEKGADLIKADWKK